MRECFPACCISGGRSNFSFSLFLFRWLHRFGLQKYSETLRKLTNEQFLELKLHPDFAKHEIFDTADKQKLQKAISCLRKERAKFSSSQISTGCVLGSSPSPRRSEGGSSIVSSSSSSSSSSSPRNTTTNATNVGGAAKTPRSNGGGVGARKTSVQSHQQQQHQQEKSNFQVNQRKRSPSTVISSPSSSLVSSTSTTEPRDSMANTSSSGNNSANSNAIVSVWQKNNLVNVQRSRNNNADGYYNNNANDEDEDPRIRVVVRARPLAPREIAKNERNVCDADPDSKTLTVFEPKVKVDLTKFTETSEFVFDDVFGGYCSDDRVYDKTVGPLVRSVLCGGNATCFAYGQTGSGKTYTMAPLPTRAAKELLSGFAEFNKVFEEEKKKNECPENGLNDAAPTSPNNEEDVGQKIELWVSAYEIYGGKVYDLLASREKLRVLEDAKNQMQIVGLSEFLCENVSEVETLIERSALERCVGQTGANAESSRSHAVIQLWIKERLLPTKARNGRQKSIYQRQQQHDLMMNSHRHPQLQNKRYHRKPLGKFSFIDLAGSERGADTTDTDRQTRAEGAEINKSLLALKECIRALDGGATHVPFRGSKLTEVLRDSFLGDSRTVMIACVSPAAGSCEHTLNTLRYADRVKELRSNVVGSLPSSSSSSAISDAPARKASLQTSSSVATIPGKRRPAFDLSFCSPESERAVENNPALPSSSNSSSSSSSPTSAEKTLDRHQRPEKKKDETNEKEQSSRNPLEADAENNSKTVVDVVDDDDDSETSHLLFEKYATSLSPPQLQRQHEKLIETILKEEFDLIDAHRSHVEQSVTRASDAAELLRVVDEPGSAVDEYVFHLANSLERQRKELDQLSARVRKFQSHLRKEDVLSKLNINSTSGAANRQAAERK